MNTILVPTDFSDCANYASDFAAQLAQQEKAELCFIHVVEIPNSEAEYYLNQTMVKGMMSEAEQKLHEISKKYTEVKDVKTFVTTSSAIDGIKKGILSMEADFIVMGKHSHFSGITDLLFDNNTEKIIRYADCPVFSISKPVEVATWKKAVIALDPESIHEDLLKDISYLTQRLRVMPHFVWVAKNNQTHSQTNIEQLKDAISAHLTLKEFSFSSAVNPNTSQGILSVAHQLHASLIILGTHARTGLSRLVRGSVTEKVVDMSEIPTLVVQLERSR